MALTPPIAREGEGMADRNSWSDRILRRLLGRLSQRKRIELLYQTHDFLDAYRRHTDLRVEEDPHEAVGGLWEEIGTLQFEFLRRKGLQAHHRMLDIGCGTLRGGRLFIRYLDAGNYSGLDISPKAIEYARRLVEAEGLSDKRPNLVVTSDLKFREFGGHWFDVLLAQSVFTHLMPAHIEECLEHIGRVMNRGAVFYFTFNKAERFEQTGVKSFRYPFAFFEDLARRSGLSVSDCSAEYPHPRGQSMVELRRSAEVGESHRRGERGT